MRHVVLLSTCAAAALGSACAGGSGATHPTPGTAADGVIHGRLLAVGGPPGISPRPLPGKVKAVGAGSTSHVATVTADGSFRINVAPGTYALTGTSPLYDSGHAQCRAQQPVRVSAGEAVTADVYCQEK